MAYIRTVEPDEATGTVAREYQAALKRAGKVFNVLRVFSLRPRTMRGTISLYRNLMLGDSPLTRAEREMVAVLTSQVNECHY
jgi:uncharacterized peroxidase-related enzyme